MEQPLHVAILGNGITGASAALELRRHQPDWRISMISGESTYPYSRPALMYIWMGHMTYQDTKPWENEVWEQQRIARIRDWVIGLDAEAKTLELQKGGKLAFDKLLLATGSKPNRFGWKGQDLDGVQSLYSLMDLRRLEENTVNCKRAVIVGGGLIGIELGEMLHSRGIHVTFLVRESSYWNVVLPKQESAMVNRLIEEAGFELLLDSELDEILPDANGHATAIRTKDGKHIDCQLVCLTAGVSPNLELVRESSLETGRGVLVNAKLETSADGIYAAGDCAEFRADSKGPTGLEQVWYTGKAQAKIVAANLAGGNTSYSPGTWYNSAKFLDLEYQTYGRVNRRVEGESAAYWERADGLAAVRLVLLNGRVIGINVMGTRFRHEVCARWIEAEAPLEQVLEQLSEAYFDPEFYTTHESEMVVALRADAASAAATEVSA